MPASSRKYPYVGFEPEREAGKDILFVEGITKTVDGVKVLDNVSFIANKGDKIALVGENEAGQTALFKILTGEMEPDAGSFKWGVSTSQSYFPQDNSAFLRALTRTLSVGCASTARTPPKHICAVFWAGCCFPATRYTSPQRCCPAAKRYAVCSAV